MLRAGHLIRQTDQTQRHAATPVVQEETLRGLRAPVVADWDDALVARDAFGVEDLRERGGLLAVVVARGERGFGTAAEAEEVGDQEGVGLLEEMGDGAGPHVRVVGEAVEE